MDRRVFLKGVAAAAAVLAVPAGVGAVGAVGAAAGSTAIDAVTSSFRLEYVAWRHVFYQARGTRLLYWAALGADETPSSEIEQQAREAFARTP